MLAILRTISLAVALLALSVGALHAQATDYQVSRDEFSNKDVHRIILGTKDSSFGGLIVSCFPSGLQAQIHVKEVIFPDDASGGHMSVQVTHKVDTAPKAATNKWRMNMMKYHDAWLMRRVETLIKEMQNGERLSLRLDRNGTIYRFDLKESHQYLPKLLAACSRQDL